MKSWLIVANNAEFDRRNLCGAARGGWRAHYFALSTRGERPFADIAQWTSLVMKTEIPRTPGAFASSIGPSLQVPLPAWRPID
jgi:hypothetical protein